MMLTTALLFNAMRDVWGWSLLVASATSLVFLVIDLAFFGANLLKIKQGGWIPLLLAVLIFVLMTTWRRGIEAIRTTTVQRPESEGEFLATLKSGKIARVPGTGVFFSRSDTSVPAVLIRHMKQIKAVPETVVSLTVRFEDTPRVPLSERATFEQVAEGFWHVTIRFGFIEVPSVASALACAKDKGCAINLDDAVYFAAHDDVVPAADPPRMRSWRRMLFAIMYRNAVRTPDRFDLPPDKFLEVGRQIAL
jgi:KUP system potassium uptake protein